MGTDSNVLVNDFQSSKVSVVVITWVLCSPSWRSIEVLQIDHKVRIKIHPISCRIV